MIRSLESGRRDNSESGSTWISLSIAGGYIRYGIRRLEATAKATINTAAISLESIPALKA
jgi:hypothetical protein